MSSKVFKKDNLVSDVIQIVHQSRNFAYSAVNFSMVVAYWKIGERIVIEEQKGNVREPSVQ
jgi:hypothetical protein